MLCAHGVRYLELWLGSVWKFWGRCCITTKCNVLQFCRRMDRYPSTENDHISYAVATKAIQLQTACCIKNLS